MQDDIHYGRPRLRHLGLPKRLDAEKLAAEVGIKAARNYLHSVGYYHGVHRYRARRYLKAALALASRVMDLHLPEFRRQARERDVRRFRLASLRHFKPYQAPALGMASIAMTGLFMLSKLAGSLKAAQRRC